MTYSLHGSLELTKGVLRVQLAIGVRVDVEVSRNERRDAGRVELIEEGIVQNALDGLRTLVLADAVGLNLTTMTEQDWCVDGRVGARGVRVSRALRGRAVHVRHAERIEVCRDVRKDA